MPLYITIADGAGLDVNLVPFTRSFDATMSSFNSISAASIDLQEMPPGTFAAEFDDLYTRLAFAKGRHVRAWQSETT